MVISSFSNLRSRYTFFAWQIVLKYGILIGGPILLLLCLVLNSKNDTSLNYEYFTSFNYYLVYLQIIGYFEFFSMVSRIILRVIRAIFIRRSYGYKFRLYEQILITISLGVVLYFGPMILRLLSKYLFMGVTSGYLIQYGVTFLGISCIKIGVAFDILGRRGIDRPLTSFFFLCLFLSGSIWLFFRMTWSAYLTIYFPILSTMILVTAQNVTTEAQYGSYNTDLFFMGAVDLLWIFFSYATEFSRRTYFFSYWIITIAGIIITLVPVVLISHYVIQYGVDRYFHNNMIAALIFFSCFFYMVSSSYDELFPLFVTVFPFYFTFVWSFHSMGMEEIFSPVFEKFFTFLNRVEVVDTKTLDRQHLITPVTYIHHFIVNDLRTWNSCYSRNRWKSTVLYLSQDDDVLPYVEGDESIELAIELLHDCVIYVNNNDYYIRVWKNWIPVTKNMVWDRRMKKYVLRISDKEIDENEIDESTFLSILSGRGGEEKMLEIPSTSIFSYFLLFSHLEMKNHMFLVCKLVGDRIDDPRFLLRLYLSCKNRFENPVEKVEPEIHEEETEGEIELEEEEVDQFNKYNQIRQIQELIDDYDEEFLPSSAIPNRLRTFQSSLSLSVFRRLQQLQVLEQDGIPRILESLEILRSFSPSVQINQIDEHLDFTSLRRNKFFSSLYDTNYNNNNLPNNEKKIFGYNKAAKKLFMDMFEKKGNSVVVTTDGRKVPVHIEILIMRSQFFFLMFHFKGSEYQLLKETNQIVMSHHENEDENVTFEMMLHLKYFFYFGHLNPNEETMSYNLLLKLMLHCDKYGESKLEEQVTRRIEVQSRHDYTQSQNTFFRILERNLDSTVLELNENVFQKVVGGIWVNRMGIEKQTIESALAFRNKFRKKKKD